MRRVLSEEMARIMIQGQETVHPETIPLCRQCGHRLWDKEEKHWSPELSKQIMWLSGVSASYEKAEGTPVLIGGIGVPDSSVWRQAQKWGQQFQAQEAPK